MIRQKLQIKTIIYIQHLSENTKDLLKKIKINMTKTKKQVKHNIIPYLKMHKHTKY